jgi:carotenoid cleavage dioxygenase-like enzyme
VTLDAEATTSMPADTAWPDNPYLRGMYAPIDDERHDTDLVVHGEVPPGLQGVYLRNGPNPRFAPLGNYHVFDGDGMIHAVDLDGGRARYRNRWVESAGLGAERRAGRALFGGLGEFRLPEPEVMEEVGMMKNTANTNIVRHAGRLLALMEAARPTELDAALHTLGEYDFGGALAGPMTAHPKVDPRTGELLFFGYSPFPPHLRYHVADAEGVLVRTVDIDLPAPVMMHDFVVTARHVVWFDLPAVFDLEAMMAGRPGITWQPDHGARIGVMGRDAQSCDDVTWIEVEPFFVFHFLNGWTTDAGTVVVDGCRAERMNTAFGDEQLDEAVPPTLHRWTIDPTTRTVTTEQLDDRPGDFPRIDDRRTGLANRYGYVAHTRTWDTDTVVFDGVVKHDLDTGSELVHRYGPSAVAGEAVFAPDRDRSAEDDGWLLNLVHDEATDQTSLVILDARDLTEVGAVEIPRRVPFGFHGNWMPT